VLHSVLRQRVPDVPIVDLTHGIARQDVRAGSFALMRAAPYLAEGAVVGVVDPGVGTRRVMVAAETVGTGGGRLFFVGPDNGLLPPALDVLGGASAAVQLEDRGYWLPARGPTFAGRDVFAPAAAELARGVALGDLGNPIYPAMLVRLPPPVVSRHDDGVLECEVTWVDCFGNVQLAALARDLPPDVGWFEVGTGHSKAPVLAGRAAAFADLAAGQLGVLVDSEGRAALCLDRGHAARALGVGEGDVVSLRPIGG
jgi:S-adenosylmethionine hydrolase